VNAAPSPDEFRMSLFEHLSELRGRLLRVTITVLVLGFVSLGFARPLFGLLMRPVLQALPADASTFVYTSAIEELNVLMKMGLYTGVFLATPVLLYQIWGFVAPGLYDNERKLAGPFVVGGTLAFLAGASFCYFVVLPSMFQFLLQHEDVAAVRNRLDTGKLREDDALRHLRLGDVSRAGAIARGALGGLEATGDGQVAGSTFALALGVKDTSHVDVKMRLEGLARLLDAVIAGAPAEQRPALSQAVITREASVKAFGEGNFNEARRLADEAAEQLTRLNEAQRQDFTDLWRLESMIGTGSAGAEALNWTKPMLSMQEQLGLVLVLELAFGVIFQLPLVMAVLGMVGLVSSAFLFKYQRHALVVCLILAAIVTPTGDAVNLALMAGPMMACYELGVLAVYVIERRRKRRAASEEAAAPT
jgi:sec-independent protein translocase protein TatC